MNVTVESALNSVHASVERLRDSVQDLVLIAVEDQPRGTEIHLTTLVHDAALDLAAEAEQAAGALRTSGHGPDVSRAATSRQVARCQARVNMLGTMLVRELAAPERLTELAALGAGRGREAGAWAGEIIRCIETCQYLLWTDVESALLGYWQELVESTGRTRAPVTDADPRVKDSHDA
jgi:hypothetical protein